MDTTDAGRYHDSWIAGGNGGCAWTGVMLVLGDGVRGELGTAEGGRGHGADKIESGRVGLVAGLSTVEVADTADEHAGGGEEEESENGVVGGERSRVPVRCSGE